MAMIEGKFVTISPEEDLASARGSRRLIIVSAQPREVSIFYRCLKQQRNPLTSRIDWNRIPPRRARGLSSR
jgi:hypothetical protein